MIRPLRRCERPFLHKDVRPYALTAAAAGLLPVALLPAAAKADTEVRWLHAAPGAGQGQLDVLQAGAREALAKASFGSVTSYSRVLPGRARLSLAIGGKTIATRSTHLAKDARYTIVALAPAAGARLDVLHDGAARAGVARLRVVHAAPELGSPDVRLDGRTVARGFRFGSASPYLSVSPGAHSASAVQPRSNMTVVKTGRVNLPAGTASTAFVLGSRGEAVRVVLVRDAKVVGVRRGTPPRSTERGRAVHVVRHGESLWSIAVQRLGARADDRQVMREVIRLWRMNGRQVPSGDPNVILPGQRLRLA